MFRLVGDNGDLLRTFRAALICISFGSHVHACCASTLRTASSRAFLRTLRLTLSATKFEADQTSSFFLLPKQFCPQVFRSACVPSFDHGEREVVVWA